MKKLLYGMILVFSIILISSCSREADNTENSNVINEKTEQKELIMTSNNDNVRTIYLAGGCFWGVEGYFTQVRGVVDTDTGYANGKTAETNYHELKQTEHAEAVRIDYDMSIISLEEILLHYFRIIDPMTLNQQGNDRGVQYRTGVYYTDDKDLEIIEKVFEYERTIHGDIVVEIEQLQHFVLAENYHQDYLAKNPNGYCHININYANAPLFDEEFKKFTEEELKENLDELSYAVLRENATEKPGTSELNDEYRKGIYVDKITGEALFASKDKFESGCGWPSFSKPILNDKIDYVEDDSLGMQRIEVRSNAGNNHLGHVFNDGPADKGGLRYCINGASLEFIPYEEMEKKGYKDYMILCE